MEHFYEKIDGWFDFQNLYSDVVQKLNDNSHIVEVGSWKGKSASYMCIEIINSGKNIKFDCVDIWPNEITEMSGNPNDEDLLSGKLYDKFLDNLKPVEGYFNPIKLPSMEASKLYKDESLDFVFIDACHKYESVRTDIISWLPKVKIGMFIGGHDYNGVEVKPAVQSLIDKNKIQIVGSISWPSWLYVKE